MTRRQGPQHRTLGLLLLLAALMTAVIVPRFDGTLTAGAPIAASVDPPPEVGTCVSRFDPTASLVTSADAQLVPVPSASYGPCKNPIAGEVLSVQPASALGDELSLNAYDTASAGCSHGIDAYLGAPAGLDGGSGATEWLPAARYNTLLVGPDLHQRAAGRTWSACVITSVASSNYAGSVRGAFIDGSLEDQFGYCLHSTDLSDWVPCSTPHTAQVLAWGTPVKAGEAPAAPAKADCLAAAAALMGTSDPAEGGALVVGLIGYEGSGSVQACGVRVDGSRSLTGSVVGIRATPLPLSG